MAGTESAAAEQREEGEEIGGEFCSHGRERFITGFCYFTFMKILIMTRADKRIIPAFSGFPHFGDSTASEQIAPQGRNGRDE